MLYSELYKDLMVGECRNDIVKTNRTELCLQCGEPTCYLELNSLAKFCSEECLDEFYEEYEHDMAEFENTPIEELEKLFDL